MIGTLFFVLSIIFWIWMLVDCIRNPNLRGSTKVIWMLVIIFGHALGAFIYMLFGRSSRRVYQGYSQSYYQPNPFNNRDQSQRQQDANPYYQPPRQGANPYYQPTQQTYQQGYQAPARQPREEGQSASGEWQQYENPQAIYPQQELPPQQR